MKKKLLENLFLVFCLLLPFQFALNPLPGVDLAIVRVFSIAVFFAWLTSIRKQQVVALLHSKITLLLAIFFLLATFSLMFSHNIGWSLRKLLFLYSFLPIFFIAATLLRDRCFQRKAFVFLITGATLLASVGLLQFCAQFIFGIDPVISFFQKISPFFLGNAFAQTVMQYPSWLVNSGGTTYVRAFGVFPDPHMFSYYLGMLIPWSIMLGITSRKHRSYFILSSVLLIAGDIASFTRGGYIALIAGALSVMPFLQWRNIFRIFLGICFITFFFFIVPHNPVTSRLNSSFDVHEGSNQQRMSLWQQSLPIIITHPLGVGIGMFATTINPAADYRMPIYAHNVYLDIAAELGIFACLVFIALLACAINRYRTLFQINILYIAGYASLIIFTIHSLVENPMYSVHVLPLFFIIIAAVALPSYEKMD